MTIALLAAAMLVLLPRRRVSARSSPLQVGDVINYASLLGLAIGGGMNLSSAIVWAGPYLHPSLAIESAVVHRQAQLHGLAAGCRLAEGAVGPLFHALARSVDTGAPVDPTIASFRTRLEAEQVAAAEEAAQRLPIKLVFPLALLMLPGLVLMIAAPALIDVLTRFD